MPIAAPPAIGSVGSVVQAPSAVSTPTVSQVVTAQNKTPSTVNLLQSAVASYPKNVYAVVLNGIAANQGGGAAGEIAHRNLVGPFGAPQPPAGSAAGLPYAPGANHNDYAAAVVQSLRSLSGNGKIFQK